jgi:Uma2 family endonuclease
LTCILGAWYYERSPNTRAYEQMALRVLINSKLADTARKLGITEETDVSVVRGETEFADEEHGIVLNPIVVIEILSDTTAAFDRGKKLQSYLQIPSLQEYLLIEQDTLLVEKYQRYQGADWLYTKVAGPEGVLQLSSIGCTLPLTDIYDKVT